MIDNDRTTALERTAAKPLGGLNAFYWRKIFAQDSVAVLTQNCFTRLLCDASLPRMVEPHASANHSGR